jgi:hypothetical protein
MSTDSLRGPRLSIYTCRVVDNEQNLFSEGILKRGVGEVYFYRF